jgi:hypothetical protein
MNTKLLFALGCLLLVGLASGAPAQEAGARSPAGTREVARARSGGAHPLRRRVAFRVRRARESVQALGITDAQRRQARDVAPALRSIAGEVRPQARAILDRARELRRGGDSEGARALLRAELRPLVESARGRALPLVEPLIRSLTVEQRAELERRARARGREFDERRAASRLARWLAR